MTTPRSHTRVSRTALTLALAACAPAPARLTDGAPAPAPAPVATAGAPLALRFDNEAHEHVHVYLVGERREWLLGRVEAGARTTLRIPAAALAENPGFVRLAVLAGARLTQQSVAEARTAVTIAQPASALASQRWAFSQVTAQPRASGQLTPHAPR